MRGSDDDTVSVDLIEVDTPEALGVVGDGPGGPLDAEPTPGAGPEPRPRGRGRIAVSAAVVLALAGAGVVLGILDDHRADARRDALAARGLPLVDLGSPVTEEWRLEYGGYPVAVSGDVLVVEAWDPALGSRNPWRGIDLVTGEVLWERPDVSDGWCTAWNPAWPEDTADVGTFQTLVGSTGTPLPPATLLACTDAGFGGQVPAPGVASTVRLIDIATGGDVAEVRVEGDLLSFDRVGGDAVVASVVADGTIDLVRVPLLGGDVRWEADADVPALDPEGASMVPWPQLFDGLLYLVSPEGTLLDVRSVDTGEPAHVPQEAPVLNVGRVVLDDGTAVEMSYPGTLVLGGEVADAVPTVTVTGPGGEERFSVEGELWMPPFSDGSMADRVVVSLWARGASSLVALDVETGEELWTSRAPWSSPVLQVDGLVVTGSGYLSAVDLRTGEEVWERPAAADVAVAPVTDGTRILVPITDRGTTSLTALDVRTGAEVWRGPTVHGLQLFVPMAGGVLVGTESTLLMYS